MSVAAVRLDFRPGLESNSEMPLSQALALSLLVLDFEIENPQCCLPLFRWRVKLIQARNTIKAVIGGQFIDPMEV